MEAKPIWRHEAENIFEAAGIDSIKKKLLEGSRVEKERALALGIALMIGNRETALLPEIIALLAKRDADDGVRLSEIAELIEVMVEKAPETGFESACNAVAKLAGGIADEDGKA